ncbi:MAG: hypothetical protein ACJ8AT_06185 [Hyalangium sp.]|uniref:hypothetical protein n=1 Tax=Hyalangium sp. TaxID=2028555 RepID=UPI00389AD922
MALRDAAADLLAALESAGVGSTSSSPPTLYSAPLPAGGPEALVSVVDFGAAEDAEPRLGGAGRTSLSPEVTVRVRGERHAFAAAQALAQAAWAACWYPAVEGYVRVVPSGSGPSYLGPDPSGRHQFSFTVRMEYRATAAAGGVTPDT